LRCENQEKREENGKNCPRILAQQAKMLKLLC